MSFAVNDSPFAGKDGDKVQSRVIRDRLLREAEGNVAIQRQRERGEASLRGRRPRRAAAGRADRDAAPRRLRARHQPPARAVPRRTRRAARSPIETVVIDVDDEYSGTVIDKMALRKAEMTDMRPSGGGKTRLTFSAPVARPDRLSWRVPVRHPRHRHHEPAVREVRPLQGPDPGPPERRADLDGAGRRPSPMRSARSRSAASCSSPPARRSTRAWSSARTPSRRTSRSIR